MKLPIISVALMHLTVVCAARAQPADEDRLPFRQSPIDYFGATTDEPVARLKTRLERGESRLEFDERRGYLTALLQALNVPAESQLLVFAKNAVHSRLTSPDNPRALFFNDSVYVGWTPGAPSLEISAVDPQKGSIFYTLSQARDGPVRLERQESCLTCHVSTSTFSVPGHLTRSFLIDETGTPTRGHSPVSDATPVAQRWGGWYVSGSWGELTHWGNLLSGRTLSIGDRVDGTRYFGPHSDIVALLVHDHQAHVQNLLTRVKYEDRLQRWRVRDDRSQARPAVPAGGSPAEPPGAATPPQAVSATEELLVRALLFADAAPLTHPLAGSSGFAERFAQTGLRDEQGRSLREFDLQTRLFKYRASYLIDSPAFDELPAGAKGRICRRMYEALGGPPHGYETFPAAERDAIVAIVRSTRPEVAAYWHD